MDVDRTLVWRYYAYRVTVGNGFWLPVGTLYMQQMRGFSLDQIGFVMGAFSVAMVAAELPPGTSATDSGAALAPLYAAAFLAVAAVPILVAPVLTLNRSLGTLMGPIRYQYVNDCVVDDGRATVLSGVSMALVLTGSVLKYLGGIAADHLRLIDALVYGALTTAVLGVALWIATSPVRPGVGLVTDDDPTATGDATARIADADTSSD